MGILGRRARSERSDRFRYRLKLLRWAAGTISTSAARLATAVFRLELAARVGTEQLARVEPVVRRGALQDFRKRSGKFTHPRAAPVPERRALRNFVEAQHFLHAAVAVRCDRKDLAGQRFLVVEAHDDVVMKLALSPMIDEIVSAESRAQRLEQISRTIGTGQGLNGLTAASRGV